MAVNAAAGVLTRSRWGRARNGASETGRDAGLSGDCERELGRTVEKQG